MKRTIYVCRNRRCPKRGQEFEAASIEDARLATGRRVHCDRCGELTWFMRNIEVPTKSDD